MAEAVSRTGSQYRVASLRLVRSNGSGATSGAKMDSSIFIPHIYYRTTMRDTVGEVIMMSSSPGFQRTVMLRIMSVGGY